ncbi:transmembrane 4 L6 family member 19 isoform X2 [Ambystoma mexicanum]|uniref:transmembrane 4 L6 family member 19 isoform X2 n=1 Tax=Ambystoma mexicanum TaxID=8296 RepID=UPI0037E8C66B
MCVGRCSRFVGLSLTSLAMVSITANALLLFPNWSWRYLTRGLITTQALLLPGIWGGGLMVLLAATQITAAGSKAHGLRCCGPRWNMFLSMLFSGLALLGSAISFGIASAGLVMGPYCLHYDPLSNQTQTLTWGSPFSDREKMSLLSRVADKPMLFHLTLDGLTGSLWPAPVLPRHHLSMRLRRAVVIPTRGQHVSRQYHEHFSENKCFYIYCSVCEAILRTKPLFIL